jgi:hypothetical protein
MQDYSFTCPLPVVIKTGLDAIAKQKHAYPGLSTMVPSAASFTQREQMARSAISLSRVSESGCL